MMSRISGFMAKAMVMVVLLVLVGCATGTVRFGDGMDRGDMSIYSTVAIRVTNDVGDKCPPDVAENLQAAAIRQLQDSYPDAFDDVRPAPRGDEDELLVDVHITRYKKGSRFARAVLIGLGSSQVYTRVDMKDSPSETLLGSGNLELVWAVGGAMGASQGIEDVVNQAGTKIADAIVAFKEGEEQKDEPRRRYSR